MNKIILLASFSILLLAPSGVSESFAAHTELGCPDMVEPIAAGVMPGILVSPTSVDNPLYPGLGWTTDVSVPGDPFCFVIINQGLNVEGLFCAAPYFPSEIYGDDFDTIPFGGGGSTDTCVAVPILVPHTTLAEQCQGASMLVDNHCFTQALNSMIGGAWLDIDTVSLLVGAIGVNPIITGLFGITMGGIAVQAVWYFNSKRLRKSNKIIPLVAFSILLLVPVGVQESFADHPDELGCPDYDLGFGEIYPGILVDTGFQTYVDTNIGYPFCFTWVPVGGCTDPLWGLSSVDFEPAIISRIGIGCIAEPISVPHVTLASQCQGASTLIDNHCFAQIMQAVGGTLLEIDTWALFVANIGVNPVITGIVAITIGGVAGQTAWFIHARRKSKNLINKL